jgi:hypothetical protein
MSGYDIYVMDADGPNVTRLAGSQPGREIHSFAWLPSPD